MIASTAAAPIALWCTFFDEIDDEGLLAEYRGILSDDERQQETRFRFQRDRRRYLVTRALLRTVLSRYAPVAPEDWDFRANAYGRPHAVNQEAQNSQLTFNLSHTNHLIALGVAHDRMIGVDTENCRLERVSLDMANRFFAAEEVANLRALPEECQRERFYEFWTLKESYIKARGLGLSIPLDSFCFDLSRQHRISLSTRSDQRDSPVNWQFWQYRLAPDYLVAVCAERQTGPAGTPQFSKVVPLVSAERITAQLLRFS